MYIYHFCFVLLCIWGQFSKYKPPGGFYLEGRFNGGFFALLVWGPCIFGGAYTWRGLFLEFYGNLIETNYITLTWLEWIVLCWMGCTFWSCFLNGRWLAFPLGHTWSSTDGWVMCHTFWNQYWSLKCLLTHQIHNPSNQTMTSSTAA